MAIKVQAQKAQLPIDIISCLDGLWFLDKVLVAIFVKSNKKEMGAQKHGSKGGGGGGYVGGFLHLFDWNAKSRKKLFSSKSESPEQPKQTKRTDGNMPMTRFNMMEEDEMIGGLNYKESSDYSCATSITDEDNYGSKAPGVVARLMGLDSLPTFNFSDTYSNPSFDSQSFKDSYTTKNPQFESIDCEMAEVSRTIKATPQKRAFEKFQTETLPPKSAKSIPITQHKLLSPIKNSRFVSSSNPKSIMEAASKIPFGGSSSSSSSLPSPSCSVPFRVKVSKEKENLSRKPKLPEGSRRVLESNGVKNLKGEKSLEPKKSISLALQAKANVQKREGLNHRVQNTERNSQKNPVSLNVLKQNNQKQNSLVDRGKSTPKPSCSNIGQQTRKQVSSQKSLSKTSENSKASYKKEPYSTTRRKRSMEDSNNNNNNNNNSNKNGEKNVVRDKSYRSNRNDVVSFTFTSPIARPVISTNGFLSDNGRKNISTNDSNSSNLSYNVIGSDALNTLLEQKLRELTGIPASVSQDSMIKDDDSSLGVSSYDPLQLLRKHQKPDQDQDMMSRDDSSYGFSSYDPLQLMKKHPGQDRIKDDSTYGFSSINPQELMKHHNLDQFTEPMSECSTNDYEYRKYLRPQQPSPNSVLEPSFISESCNSSDTAESSKPNSTSVQAQDLITNNFSTNISRNPTPMEVDTELLDSASSSSTTKLAKWEPDYVTKVLEDIETMFTDFTIGKTRKLVNPRVFDRLEFGTKVDDEKVVKLRRELVFNCVSECMETKCRVWGKGLAMVSRPDRLAQEVYKEIEGWEDMKDSMVDELVDKDMSGEGYKRWLDFDVEAFEYGVELESWLIDSLINEVVDDMLVL
ncbi:hypothetical protein L2E82_06046 [Cichorium intybus]|uniref:Uncharacterized protein n=1 Tax=Cichorium intybus TaxID=13427 RepID=A0ACB9HA55_CICIN|nr:hypothetical protein L2E82_06046 [Cichorium intybus]